MHRQYNEDLFESTKMTFGEHLDELRGALIKAVASLTIGFLLGLLVGRQLVAYIQTPLRHALRDHYSEAQTREYRQYLEQRKAEGKPVPADIDAAVAQFAEQSLITDEIYIDPGELGDALREQLPKAGAVVGDLKTTDNNGTVKREDLLKIRIYRDLDRDPRLKLVGLGTEEGFVVFMKAALVIGIVISSPAVFYFLWQFVAAGLYPHEQKYVHIFLPFSIALFLAGAALAFFFAFKYVLAFLLWFYETMQLDPQLRISDWLSFVLILPIGFGVSFQLPLVMLFLERIGIFSVKTYLSHWRFSVLVIAFLSMILTPGGDPYSMSLMAAPLVLLYFIGVALCKWMPQRTTPFGEVMD